MARSTAAPVTLHVGTPKSGTTSLQGILARNRALLAENGLLYPGDNQGHFIEALSLRESGFRGHRFAKAEGAWDRVVEQIGAHPGPALLSHEIIGGSVPKVLKRAVRSFAGRPVTVVITCRDLARQLPAVWQEGVKNGDTGSYGDFLAEAFGEWAGPDTPAGFWRGQNLAGLARRWAEQVGVEQVRLVTVPAAGADKDVLWQRFVLAAGLPDVEYDLPAQVRNPSLGTVETELLRRIVARLPEDVPWPTYAKQVKRRLAQRTLVKHKADGSLTVPDEWRAETDRVSGEVLTAITEGGFPVVGDLADLAPSYREDGTSPDDVSDTVLLERALEVLAPMVLRDQAAAQKS